MVIGTHPEIINLAPIMRMLESRAGCCTAVSIPRSCPAFPPAWRAAAETETLSGIGRAPRHAQIGRLIERLGATFSDWPPVADLVQGDTNSASAGAQASNDACAAIGQVEAGFRTFDPLCPRS